MDKKEFASMLIKMNIDEAIYLKNGYTFHLAGKFEKYGRIVYQMVLEDAEGIKLAGPVMIKDKYLK